MHKVERTNAGKYAVTLAGETLAEFESEHAALTAAAALNRGPVEWVRRGPRWTEEAA